MCINMYAHGPPKAMGTVLASQVTSKTPETFKLGTRLTLRPAATRCFELRPLRPSCLNSYQTYQTYHLIFPRPL